MKISNEKKEKIIEQILAFLFSKNPQAIYTSHIAEELARDEEFIKKILLKMVSKGLVIQIKQNSKGVLYLRRSRWKLTNKIYNLYSSSQG